MDRNQTAPPTYVDPAMSGQFTAVPSPRPPFWATYGWKVITVVVGFCAILGSAAFGYHQDQQSNHMAIVRVTDRLTYDINHANDKISQIEAQLHTLATRDNVRDIGDEVRELRAEIKELFKKGRR